MIKTTTNMKNTAIKKQQHMMDTMIRKERIQMKTRYFYSNRYSKYGKKDNIDLQCKDCIKYGLHTFINQGQVRFCKQNSQLHNLYQFV